MDILSNKTLSKNLKKHRGRLGLSQDRMARKLDIPYSTYVKIESGQTPNPSIQTVLDIAVALNKTVDELIKSGTN